MNLYTIHSESHREMALKYLLPSIPDSIQCHYRYVSHQHCESGSFYNDGWTDACYEKVVFFRDICLKEMGNIFIFSDADVQFLGDPVWPLLSELGSRDIACQDDINQFCSGFFVCRANEATLDMFNAMIDNYRVEDQFMLNECIHMVQAKKLSHRFYNVAHSIHSVWNGQSFDIPEDILVHHANWVVGVENKCKLMDLVRTKYDILRKQVQARSTISDISSIPRREIP